MKVNGMQWDVFCQVIDNYGDAGVCWRLANNLAQRGQRVRLWIDDPAPLAWMSAEVAQALQTIPESLQGQAAPCLPADGITVGEHQRIRVLPWSCAEEGRLQIGSASLQYPDVLVEAFGCEIPQAYLHQLAQCTGATGQHAWPQWINLEYLSAESYVERMHLLQSPVMFGPAQGQAKTFFYPGFTAQTGGVLREPLLLQAQAQFDRQRWRSQWFARPEPELLAHAQWISLFAYEPACLKDWLQQWAHSDTPVVLLALAGRSQAWLRSSWQALGWPWSSSPAADQLLTSAVAPQRYGNLTVFNVPHVSQQAFDEVLWACDCNIVRGEDSLVRALWAGQPFLWHIYPQDDNAHHDKLDAFLDWLQAPPAWRAAMHQLNGMAIDSQPAAVTDTGPAGHWPSVAEWDGWRQRTQQAKQALLSRDDLATALLKYVQEQQWIERPI